MHSILDTDNQDMLSQEKPAKPNHKYTQLHTITHYKSISIDHNTAGMSTCKHKKCYKWLRPYGNVSAHAWGRSNHDFIIIII